MQPRFAGRTSISVRALLVGERLELRSLEKGEMYGVTPLMIAAGDRGSAVLFRYGAVVLFDVSPVEEVSFLGYLRPLIVEPFESQETEEVTIRVDPDAGERADNGVVWLRNADIERLQVVADVLARSVVLAHYEDSIAAVFDSVEPLARALERKGSARHQAAELLPHIGRTLLIQHKMVGRVEVEEKPEMLWEHPEFERLYYRLTDEYELRERHRALERKMAVVSRTAETMLGLLQNRSSLRVEWYIVILIIFEIMLTLWELFLRPA